MGVRTVQPHRAAGGRVARRPAVSHNEGVRKRPRKGARRRTADSLVFSFLSAADVVEARLEKDGLVRRRADPDDRRSVLAELTPAGEQAHAKGVRALADAQRAIVKALKAGE